MTTKLGLLVGRAISGFVCAMIILISTGDPNLTYVTAVIVTVCVDL